MFRETLPYAKCDQFYTLLNSLTLAAHYWLDMPGELFIGDPAEGLLDEQASADALGELWKSPHIIDRFVQENPVQFDDYQMGIVTSWKNAVTREFIVFEHGGTLLFLSGGRLFHVTGIIDPVRDVLGDAVGYLPCVVHATLLPFENYIVYDGFLMPFPMHMGDGMRRQVETEIAQALASGEHVSTGARLIELAPIMAEERIQQETERMMFDLEMDAKSKEQLPDHHAGPLAGLSALEREQAVNDHLQEQVRDRYRFDGVGYLDSLCEKGPATRDLGTLLLTDSKDQLRRLCEIFGLPNARSRTKARLVDDLLPVLSTNDFMVSVQLQGCTPRELKAFRDLYDAGGELRIPAETVREQCTRPRDLDHLPTPMKLVCYLFREKGSAGRFDGNNAIPEGAAIKADAATAADVTGAAPTAVVEANEKATATSGATTAASIVADAVTSARDEFVFVIPHETMNVLDGFDWEQCEYFCTNFERSVDIAEALVSLRGAVSMDEAYDEFRRCYPDGFSSIDFAEGVHSAWESDLSLYEIVDLDGEEYLAHHLIVDYPDERDSVDDGGVAADGTGDAFDDDNAFDDSFLQMILQLREGKVPRPLGDLRTLTDVEAWKSSLPAVRAMRSYLDEHVPDGKDDYFFAEDVTAELVSAMSFGVAGTKSVDIYYSILEDYGLRLNEAHFMKVVDLLMNMSNAIPVWTNNGWAPNELHEAQTGKKLFYNEDGSVKKVGRNDPCPCGSGKKYKKCCGR